MCKLVVVVVTVVLLAHSKCLVPFQTDLFPFCKPLKLSARLYKELHLHLLKLSHSEDELSCYNLVSESFTNLCNTKRQLHTAGFLYVQVVYKDTLSSLWSQVNCAALARYATKLGAEHKVELSYVCPVLCSRDRTSNLAVKDKLFQCIQVVCIQCSNHSLSALLNFLRISKDVRVSCLELLLVKCLTEFLAAFLYIFIDFLLKFCNVLLKKNVCPISFL